MSMFLCVSTKVDRSYQGETFLGNVCKVKALYSRCSVKKGLESTLCILEFGRTLRDIFRTTMSIKYALVIGTKDGVSAAKYIGSPKLA